MTAAYKKKKKGSASKVLKVLLIVALLVGAAFAWFLFAPNTGSFSNGQFVYIKTGSAYDDVKQTLVRGGFIRDERSFDLLARRAGYPEKVRAGKYKIEKGMSNYSIVRLLRSGRQTPVKLVITKLRTKQDFIRLVSKNLEADSVLLSAIMNDNNFLAQYGLDSNTAMCAVMPNTYEFYWNTDAEKAFRKIAKTFTVFWTSDRLNKASRLALSPKTAITLASIVEEETNKQDEKSKIAGVYLNRIAKGMRLQADPTARFAFGDFMIKRITGVQTSFISPYNTYQVYGLPPGPICTPSAATIDAVLQSPKTNFLFFCAREDFSGYHNFAATLAEHSANAKKYHDALNRRNIR